MQKLGRAGTENRITYERLLADELPLHHHRGSFDVVHQV